MPDRGSRPPTASSPVAPEPGPGGAVDRGSSGPASRDWRLQSIVVLAATVLLGVTWKLWIPQSVFPQVPLIETAISWPPWWQWIGPSILGTSLAAAAARLAALRLGRAQASQRRLPAGDWALRLAWTAVAAGWIGCWLMDQHRLQPWAYQFTILALLWAVAPPGTSVLPMRLLTVSIYVYSAAGKFDHTFLHTVGPQLLRPLPTVGGEWAVTASCLLPAGELLAACCLLLPRLRQLGVGLACGMHAALAILLGPWGLNHEWGVVAWNLFFLAWIPALFWDHRGRRALPPAWPSNSPTAVLDAGRQTPTRPAAWRAGLAHLIAAAVIGLPLLEGWGLWDHWLCWGLYSPRNSRALCLILARDRPRLPEELRSYTTAFHSADPHAPRGAEWLRVDFDRYSLDRLHAPIYPQDRFQVGCCLWLAARVPGLRIRCEHWSLADRFHGGRRVRSFYGTRQIETLADSFRINARPRRGHRLSTAVPNAGPPPVSLRR